MTNQINRTINISYNFLDNHNPGNTPMIITTILALIARFRYTMNRDLKNFFSTLFFNIKLGTKTKRMLKIINNRLLGSLMAQETSKESISFEEHFRVSKYINASMPVMSLIP